MDRRSLGRLYTIAMATNIKSAIIRRHNEACLNQGIAKVSISFSRIMMSKESGHHYTTKADGP